MKALLLGFLMVLYLNGSFGQVSHDKAENKKATEALLTEIAKRENINWLTIDSAVIAGADVNAMNQDSMTVLIEAAFHGQLKTTQLVLSKGANVNAQSSQGTTALMFASSRGHLKIVQLLLEAGADIHLRDRHRFSALSYASGGEWEIVDLLLDKGARFLTSSGLNSCFWQTVFREKAETAARLLKIGADVNTPMEKTGVTPLHYATSRENPDLIKLLLENGADVNAKDTHGETALMKAVYDSSSMIINLLLTHGADINAKDNDGSTALDRAVSYNRLSTAKLLLEKGAAPNSALWLAPNKEMYNLLRSYRAKE